MLDVVSVSQSAQLAGLIAVDNALGALTGDQSPGRRKLRAFYAAVLQALDGLPRPHEEDLLDEMFSPGWSNQQKRLIAVCLLRLLATAPSAFDDPRIIGKSQGLWDDALPDLYKQLKLKQDAGGFDKRQALRDAIPRAQTDLMTVIEDVRGVDEVNGLRVVRERWRKLIDRHGPLIAPFLPSELLRKRNDQLFETTAEVYGADDAELMRTYQLAIRVCMEYKASATAHGTLYAERFCGALASEMANQLEIYKSSRVLRPADIQVRPGNKRYPLHEEGREIRLAFSVANSGEGVGLDARISIEALSGVDITNTEVFLGTVGTGRQVVECSATVDGSHDSAEVLGTVSWRNADGSSCTREFDVTFEAQRSDLDWAALDAETPYLLTAIRDPSKLIGRDQLLTSLESAVRAENMSSFVVSGHKRVGKTSIVLCLKTVLETRYDDTIVAYLQIGKFRSSPRGLYKGIARAITTAARRQSDRYPQLLHLQRPDFDDGFAEILDLVDDVLDISPNLRLVLMLDEFDELPTSLYQINDEAAAFFNTLRDFVAQPRRSLTLVGGEKLNFVLTANGAALNLLESHRVDDFRREDQFSDFASLVTLPATGGVLDFEDGSVERIFDESAGHPYFAKMIGRVLFQQMKARRDASVTPAEVDEAVTEALRGAG